MNVQSIESLDDPRVGAYRNLKDRELAARGGLFIAEGVHVVRRLLESNYPTVSVLAARRRADEIAALMERHAVDRPEMKFESTPLLVVPDDLVDQIVGFQFHS